MCRLCCEQVRIKKIRLFGLLEGECNSLEQPLPPVLILLPYLDWCLQNLCKGLKEFVCVCSILFQRGIYPSEEFSRVKKYGMTLLICQQEKVKAFIETITAQLLS